MVELTVVGVTTKVPPARADGATTFLKLVALFFDLKPLYYFYVGR